MMMTRVNEGDLHLQAAVCTSCRLHSHVAEPDCGNRDGKVIKQRIMKGKPTKPRDKLTIRSSLNVAHDECVLLVNICSLFRQILI